MLLLIAYGSILGALIYFVKTIREYLQEGKSSGGRKTSRDRKFDKEHNLTGPWPDDSLHCAIITVIMVAVLCISTYAWRNISDKMSEKTYEETFQTATYELELLENSIKMEGYRPDKSLYVYGVKDTDDGYIYYYKSNGKNDKVYSENTIINERPDDCMPILIESTTYTKNKMNPGLANFLALLTGQFNMVEGVKISYEMILPEGTINIQE